MHVGQTKELTVWWAQAEAVGDYTKIVDSQLDYPMKRVAGDTNSIYISLPEFTIDVNAGDEIILLAESVINDGAYFSTNAKKDQIVDTKINFEEIIPPDDPPRNCLPSRFRYRTI